MRYQQGRQTATTDDEEARLRCRVRLLTLAGDLDDVGVRARLRDTVTPPYVLRAWDPDKAGPTLTVECGPDATDRLKFFDGVSRVVLDDAEEALEPGDTVDLARMIRRNLDEQRRVPVTPSNATSPTDQAGMP